MTLDPEDAQLLHDIANLRRWLGAPVWPAETEPHLRAAQLLHHRARLAELELELVERGLRALGLAAERSAP